MNTPWGASQGKGEVLAPGIISYSTPSHGGIRLSPERQAEIRAKLPEGGLKTFTGGYEWWEEDCDWAVPYMLFSQDILMYGKAYKYDENLTAAIATVKRWNPEIFA